MKKRESLISIFLLLLAIYIAVTSYFLELGTLKQPGPGFFPFGGALIMGICAISDLLGNLLRNQTEQLVAMEEVNWRNVTFVFGAVCVFAILLERFGFFLCTFLMFIFFQRVVSSQSWTKAVIVASCAAIGNYIVFDFILNAQLPKGFINF